MNNDFSDEDFLNSLKDCLVTKNKGWEHIDPKKQYKVINGPLGKTKVYELPEEFNKLLKLK